jgi:hypothetical protein
MGEDTYHSRGNEYPYRMGILDASTTNTANTTAAFIPNGVEKGQGTANITMSSISFNFSDLDNLRTALDSLQCTKQPSKSSDYSYLSPLRRLAADFGSSVVGQYGLENAETLAFGCHRDIIVVLIEPTNSASYLPPEKMYRNSPTLIWLDNALKQSSGGVRTWENTRIFDIRPFRNAQWRERNNTKAKESLDERAYKAFEEMIRLAKPDVVLVCQCGTAGAKNTLANMLSSSIESAGTVRLLDIPAPKILVVQGFHPSHFTRWDWEAEELSASDTEEKDDMNDGGRERQKHLASFREHLLELAILTTINAAAGRSITGLGRQNLSHCSLEGFVFGVGQVKDQGGKKQITTCEWISQRDVTSPEVMECLEALQLVSWLIH